MAARRATPATATPSTHELTEEARIRLEAAIASARARGVAVTPALLLKWATTYDLAAAFYRGEAARLAEIERIAEGQAEERPQAKPRRRRAC